MTHVHFNHLSADHEHLKDKLIINPITVKLLILNFYQLENLKLCLADAIHNFKWVKIIQTWQNGGQLFSIFCRLMARFIFNMFKSWYMQYVNTKRKKHEYNRYLQFEG